MIIAITGTPGTGKTSVCKALGLEFMDLNRVIKEERYYTGVDNERGSLIADLDKVEDYVKKVYKEDFIKARKRRNLLLLIESHLAHFLKPDIAIVLRANPLLLIERLKQKGFPAQKIAENVEAETLDVILAEAVELCEIVYEIDTSEKGIEGVASTVRAIIDTEMTGKKKGKKVDEIRETYKPGSVNWSRYIEKVCLAETNP